MVIPIPSGPVPLSATARPMRAWPASVRRSSLVVIGFGHAENQAKLQEVLQIPSDTGKLMHDEMP